MSKPRIIIADTDIGYIIPLQAKFAEDFFEEIDLEIITEESYFQELFSTPQKADILIISENLYDSAVQRHNISNVFVMDEQLEEERTGELSVNHIFKYTSIKEIFTEILGKSSGSMQLAKNRKQETQVVVFYSASGGAGKTTAAVGISAALVKNYKRVLYINAARLQVFQHMLKNHTPITASELSGKLAEPNRDSYAEIKHLIRNESFSYLPPFKTPLMSMNIPYTVFEKIAVAAKNSGDYDYIVVDADVTFDEGKAALLQAADRVIIVMRQSMSSVLATNLLVSNINGANSEKYTYVCNDFDKDEDNALISPRVSLKFSVSDYIDHFEHYEGMGVDDLARESSIQKAAFLLM